MVRTGAQCRPSPATRKPDPGTQFVDREPFGVSSVDACRDFDGVTGLERVTFWVRFGRPIRSIRCANQRRWGNRGLPATPPARDAVDDGVDDCLEKGTVNRLAGQQQP
jgi:hypothetical protein